MSKLQTKQSWERLKSHCYMYQLPWFRVMVFVSFQVHPYWSWMSLHQFWWSAEQIRGLGLWCCGSGAEWTVRKHCQRTQPCKTLSNANTIQRTQPINYFDNNVSSCFILIQSVFVILHGIYLYIYTIKYPFTLYQTVCSTSFSDKKIFIWYKEIIFDLNVSKYCIATFVFLISIRTFNLQKGHSNAWNTKMPSPT